MRYRTKQTPEFDAVQWLGNNTVELKRFIGDVPGVAAFVKRRGVGMTEALWQNVVGFGPRWDRATAAYWDKQLSRYVPIHDHDWVTKHNGHAVYDPITFDALYEPVPEPDPAELTDLAVGVVVTDGSGRSWTIVKELP